jgi:hypothetical protein
VAAAGGKEVGGRASGEEVGGGGDLEEQLERSSSGPRAYGAEEGFRADLRSARGVLSVSKPPGVWRGGGWRWERQGGCSAFIVASRRFFASYVFPSVFITLFVELGLF